jgi:hypothetical protein
MITNPSAGSEVDTGETWRHGGTGDLCGLEWWRDEWTMEAWRSKCPLRTLEQVEGLSAAWSHSEVHGGTHRNQWTRRPQMDSHLFSVEME